MAEAASVQCTRCGRDIPGEFFDTKLFFPCPGCRTPLRVDTFPALSRPAAQTGTGGKILLDGEAGCFYHHDRKAAVCCDVCGRFLCALCDLPVDGRHFCPPCLEEKGRAGAVASLEHHRRLHDNLALALAGIPLFVFPVTLVTAPLALYHVYRAWKAPPSIVPKTRTRAVIAASLGLVQIAAWAVAAVYLVLRAV